MIDQSEKPNQATDVQVQADVPDQRSINTQKTSQLIEIWKHLDTQASDIERNYAKTITIFLTLFGALLLIANLGTGFIPAETDNGAPNETPAIVEEDRSATITINEDNTTTIDIKDDSTANVTYTTESTGAVNKTTVTFETDSAATDNAATDSNTTDSTVAESKNLRSSLNDVRVIFILAFLFAEAIVFALFLHNYRQVAIMRKYAGVIEYEINKIIGPLPVDPSVMKTSSNKNEETQKDAHIEKQQVSSQDKALAWNSEIVPKHILRGNTAYKALLPFAICVFFISISAFLCFALFEILPDHFDFIAFIYSVFTGAVFFAAFLIYVTTGRRSRIIVEDATEAELVKSKTEERVGNLFKSIQKRSGLVFKTKTVLDEQEESDASVDN